MSLIKCPECGKEISDKADKCINCGFPIQKSEEKKSEFVEYYNNPIINKNMPKPKIKKNEHSAARFVISILMLVFSTIVLFQSCAAGVVNSIEGSGNTDGSTGLLIFLCMIIFGIIGIVTKNTKSHKSLLVLAALTAIIYIYCAFIYNGIYEDLKIWGWLFGIYSLIFSFSCNSVKQNNQ